MWYLVAFLAGCLIAGLILWLWKRGERQPLAGYTPEQAEKERERITAHAESEREKVADTAKAGHDAIDNF